jgi:integrase
MQKGEEMHRVIAIGIVFSALRSCAVRLSLDFLPHLYSSAPRAAKARKAPILAETARAMAHAAPKTIKGLRDRALLLLGFAGAFRRSELVALNVEDLEETDDGFRIKIRRQQDRPGGRRTDDRYRARICSVPGEGGQGMARCRD